MNIYDRDNILALTRPVVGSPTPLALEPPSGARRISSMTWSNTEGGRVDFIMTDPLPALIGLGSDIVVSGATNGGTAGNGAVNGTFTIDSYTDPSNFGSRLTAPAGSIGVITTTSASINLSVSALTWSRGTVIAKTENPLLYPLGAVVRFVIDGAEPAGYNGVFYCTISQPQEFRYSLSTDPGGPSTKSGTFSPDVNLIEGYFDISSLVYRESSRQFEVRP